MGGKFLAVFLLGFGLIWVAIRFFESRNWINWNNSNEATLASGDKLEVTFLVIACIFVVLYIIGLINNTINKNRLGPQYGLKGAKPTLSQLFTFPMMHSDYDHLLGNTPKLLLFAALSVIITPSLQAFILASIVILLVQGLAIILFDNTKIPHIGASGFITGYFAFVVAYGLTLMSWQSIIAVLTLIFFGSHMFRLLGYKAPGVSALGHFWGFMGGIFAAILLYQLGNPPI